MAKKGNETVTVLVDTSDLVRHVNGNVPRNVEGRPMYFASTADLLRAVERRRYAPLYRYGDVMLWPIDERDKIRSAVDKAMLADLRLNEQQRTAPVVKA